MRFFGGPVPSFRALLEKCGINSGEGQYQSASKFRRVAVQEIGDGRVRRFRWEKGFGQPLLERRHRQARFA
jgi:hypothetical protein